MQVNNVIELKKKALHIIAGNYPDDVAQRARILLADVLGVGFSGTITPVSKTLTNHIKKYYTGDDPILFSGGNAGAIGCALHGGSTVDSIDAHDGHPLTKGHTGCALIPALLIAKNKFKPNMTGKELLGYVVAGYEIGTRLGIAQHEVEPTYHASGSWMATATAFFAGLIADVDDDTLKSAVGAAEYHAPISNMMHGVAYPAMGKDSSGYGCMVGIQSLLLAIDGYDGGVNSLIYDPNKQNVWNDLNENWITMTTYVKMYPVCRWAQPPIEALRHTIKQNNLSNNDISKVIVKTFHHSYALYQGVPRNTEESQYSVVFPLACLLTHNRIDADMMVNGMNDDTIIQTMNKIEMREDDQYSAKFPAERWASVEVHTTGGDVFNSPDMQARGDATTPVSDMEMQEKFMQYCQPVLGDMAETLFNLCMTIDTDENAVNQLTKIVNRTI
ncbi:MAG: MmgE/PrpD family protein [Alphaproteobacteria bacterium]